MSYKNSNGEFFVNEWITPINFSTVSSTTQYLYSVTTYGDYKDANGNALQGLYRNHDVYGSDDFLWKVPGAPTQVIVPLKAIRKGYMPVFESATGSALPSNISSHNNIKFFHTSTADSQSSLTMKWSPTMLQIGTTNFPASYFRDGAIPRRIGVLMVAGGGGGGGTSGLTGDGTGGGAGSFEFGILKLDPLMDFIKRDDIETESKDYVTLTLKYGAGGAGGYKNEQDSDSTGRGADGGNSEIYLKYKQHTSGGSSTGTSIYFKTNGGHSGYSSEEFNHGGASGGIRTNNSTAYVDNWFRWPGGNGGKRKAAGEAFPNNVDGRNYDKVCEVTTNSEEKSNSKAQLRIVLPDIAGGSVGNGYAGGGGSSALAKGGNGGGVASNGNAGSLGSGGGGARWTAAQYKRGGRGGAGAIYLFY